MVSAESTRLWPRSTPDERPEVELRQRHAELLADCATLLADRVDTLFDRRPAEIAELLDVVAELRATALYWNGHLTAELAGDHGRADLLDLQLLAAAAVDAVDEVLQAVEQGWLALPMEPAARLLAEPVLARYRHYLSSVRSLAPYLLGAVTEAALAARDNAAGAAWVQLYYQVTGSLRPVVAGEPLSLETARSELGLADPVRRVRCLDAVYAALEPVAPVLSHCLDSLVADRLAVDEVRGLPYPRAERDLTNELSPAVVDGMLAVVEEHYHLPQRWFARKAALLGADRLDYAHMRAPVATSPPVPYPVAVRAVTEAFGSLVPWAGELVTALIAGGMVDADPRDRKQTGASCRSLGPGRAPRILLSYFGTVEDVVALAHELGHALHFTLAGREHNGLIFDAPMALNEIAPAFTELLVGDWLIEHEVDPTVRTLLAAKRVDSAIDAIFMSTFLTRFETRIHQARADGRTLTDDRLRELWIECGTAFYGPDVELPEKWGLHWMLVPHVTHDRFYSYTYAFARLLGLNLYTRYRRDPDGFLPRFLELLGRGGTAGPAEQLAAVGIDLADSETWRCGIARFAALLDPLLAG